MYIQVGKRAGECADRFLDKKEGQVWSVPGRQNLRAVKHVDPAVRPALLFPAAPGRPFVEIRQGRIIFLQQELSIAQLVIDHRQLSRSTFRKEASALG